jgi:predicted nucleic acid-binding protein
MSVYDAAYLELAERIEAPLATFDATLARVARERGLQLVF